MMGREAFPRLALVGREAFPRPAQKSRSSGLMTGLLIITTKFWRLSRKATDAEQKRDLGSEQDLRYSDLPANRHSVRNPNRPPDQRVGKQDVFKYSNRSATRRHSKQPFWPKVLLIQQPFAIKIFLVRKNLHKQ